MKVKTVVRRLGVLVLATSLAACQGLEPEYNVKGKPVKAGLSLDQVEKAVLQGAEKAGWQTIVDSPGVITATYQKPGLSILTEITYDERSYGIHYLSGTYSATVCPEYGPENNCSYGGQSMRDDGLSAVWMDRLNTEIGNVMDTF